MWLTAVVAHHTLFRLAAPLAVIVVMAVAASSPAHAQQSSPAHAQQVDDSLPPLADLTIASHIPGLEADYWLVTVKNNTVGAHPGMHVHLVKVRITLWDPVRGTSTQMWTIRDLPPGGSVVGPPDERRRGGAGIDTLANKPKVTDEPRWAPQRLYAEIIESDPVESPRFLFNNATESWVIEDRHGGAGNNGKTYFAIGDIAIDRVSISDRLPQAGGATTFTVALSNDPDRLPNTDIATAEQHNWVFDVQVKISLSPGLSFAATQPEAPTGTTFVASTGIWNVGATDSSVGPSLPVAVNLTSDSLADLPLQERCLTAKVVNAKPWFANDPRLANDTATACLGQRKVLVTDGELPLWLPYSCVNSDGAFPCTDEDSLLVVSEISDRIQVSTPGDPTIFVHIDPVAGAIVDDRAASVNGGGAVSWQTANDRNEDRGVELKWSRKHLVRNQFNNVDEEWSSTIVAQGGDIDDCRSDTDDERVDVTARASGLNGASAPGQVQIRYDSTSGPSFVQVNPPGERLCEWGNKSSSLFSRFAEFEKLGTYLVDFTVSADHSDGNHYTGTNRAIFHVGPIAELAVSDGGARPDLTSDQVALTIVAVNNGPDRAVGAVVDIDIDPKLVAEAIASDGTYSNGTWDLGALRPRDDRRDAGLTEEATLTLFLKGENAAGTTVAATIRNAKDYSVCIDSSGDDVDLSSPSDTACTTEDSTNTWHTVPVYDYRDDNNEATLKARRGTGEEVPAEGGGKPFVAVVWQPVAGVNGFAVSHYQVWRSSCSALPSLTQAPVADDVTGTSWVDLDVVAGDIYCYQVRAVNYLTAQGPFSRVMEKKALAPSAPTAGAPEEPVLTATPNEPNGDTQILLTWAKPVENGSAITAYTLEVSDTGRNGSWADTSATLGPDATSWPHTGLDPGTRKYYRLRATNALGHSPWSEVVAVSTRAVGILAAPINVVAAPDGGNAIDVSWDVLQRDGGNAITRYEVQWSADGVSGWRSAGRTADGLTLTFKDSGLAFGETRHYRVAARNSRGLSDWSYPPYASATTPTGVPGVPRLTAQAKSDSTINLTWTVPASNDGRIIRYDIESSPDGAPGNWKMLEAVVETTGEGVVRNSHVDSSLEPVQTRYYRVRAVNDTGAGSWSLAASATTPTKPGAGPPTAPLNLTLVAGDGHIEALWDPPANNGGAPIKEYSVQFRDSGSWETVPHGGAFTGSFIIEHSDGRTLTNGRRYYVRVAAINENGIQGPYAQASAVPNIPPRAPNEPPNVVPTGGDGQIEVTWREPYDVGHPALSGYRVQYREDGSQDWLPATPISARNTARSATITGLTNGTTYQVQVWAVNSTGASPKAGADGKLKATPVAEEPEPPPDDPKKGETEPGSAPSAPRNLALTPGDGEIQVSWDPPEDLGQPEIEGYTLEHRADGEDSWNSRKTTATSATIAGLTNRTEYEVRVLASNEHGEAIAGPKQATPKVPPGPAAQNLVFVEQRTFQDVDGSTKKEFVVSWTQPPTDSEGNEISFSGYKVQFRRGTSGDWLDTRCTIADNPPPIEETCSDHRGGRTPIAGIMGVSSGTYEVRVAAVYSHEGPGAWTMPLRVQVR